MMKSNFFRKFITRLNKYKKIINDELILVYQMGKVGSDTVCATLSNHNTLHLHTLYCENPNDKFLVDRGLINTSLRKFAFSVFRFVLKRKGKKNKIKIITLYREVMDRNISMFFQDLESYIYKSRSLSYENYLKYNSGGLDVLVDLFYEHFDFDYADNWFDKEINKFTGIDLTSDNLTNGKIMSNSWCDILILDLAELNTSGKIIGHFIKDDVTIKQSNSFDSKWYSLIYQEFKILVRNDSRYKNLQRRAVV